MTFDRYTRVVLTLIAACLLWICIRDLHWTSPAQAQDEADTRRQPPATEPRDASDDAAAARPEHTAESETRAAAGRTLVARELILVDKAGRPRAIFGMADDEAPQLVLADQAGNFRLVLDIAEDGVPLIQLRDRDGMSARLAASMLPRGSPYIGLYDSRGVTRAAIGLGAGEAPGFAFSHVDGRTRAGISVTPDGLARLTIGDDEGRTRIGLGLHPDGAARLDVYGAGERVNRASLTAPVDATPSLTLFDTGGHTAWTAP